MKRAANSAWGILLIFLPWLIGFAMSWFSDHVVEPENAVSEKELVAAVEEPVVVEAEGRGGNPSRYAVTDSLVYIAYTERSALVDAYDHDGNYQFSIHFAARERGALQIRTQDGLLYVHTKYGNVFVFDGREEVCRLTREEAGEAGLTAAWFQERETSTRLRWRKLLVYDAQGKLLHTVQLPLDVFLRELYGLGILALVFAVIAYKGLVEPRKKKKQLRR